jgi:hypothetical protein
MANTSGFKRLLNLEELMSTTNSAGACASVR